MYTLKTILEVVYSTGDIEKVQKFFCEYGGWETLGAYETDASVLNFWNLNGETSGQELLLQGNQHPTGLIRLVQYHEVEQQWIRSSQKPWDVGGIMDINLRVHDVHESFDELREMGWHGLSDPLFQEMGPFKLYDILMKGYDDIIVGFTHRTQPKLDLPEGLKLPTHIYNSSIVVHDLEESKQYYQEGLGFTLLNEYQVNVDEGEDNMFGLPVDITDKVTCKGNIYSLDGERDVIFQAIEFGGLTGKDFSARSIPPNKGLLLYRCEVEGIEAYYHSLGEKKIPIHQPLQEILIEPYGKVNSFAVISPNGVWWEFLEKN